MGPRQLNPLQISFCSCDLVLFFFFFHLFFSEIGSSACFYLLFLFFSVHMFKILYMEKKDSAKFVPFFRIPT